MHLVTYAPRNVVPAVPSLGWLWEGRVYDVPALGATLGLSLPADMLSFLALGEAGPAALAPLAGCLKANTLPYWRSNQVDLWAPIPRPGKVLAVAGNFLSHIREGGGEDVQKARITPRFFLKPSTAVIGPGADIVRPALSETVDYELELGVVIGRRGRYIPAEKALDYVGGYVIFNDVSARTLTLADKREKRDWDDFFDWLNGKWFDTFAAMGPYLATADEVPDPQRLGMRLSVNGVVRQEGSTGQMLFDVAELVAFISQFTTMEPGDVIATGTPGGVGATTDTYLKAGDLIVATIEGLGELQNRVVDEPAG